MNERKGDSGRAPGVQNRPSGAEATERRVPWWRNRARLIIVPLDGSEEAKVALTVARVAGQIAQASVEVIHASDELLTPEELLKRVGLRREETVGIAVEQVRGDPATAIAHIAERRQAMLIAMAIHGLSTVRGRTVSPIVESVLQQVEVPVLLVRPELADFLRQPELHQILLPLDGTPSSAAAIGPALEMADRTRARVDILYVAPKHGEPPQEPGSLTAPLYVDQPQYEWPAWSQEFARRFGTALGQYKPKTPTQVFVRSGEPADEIVRFAKEQASSLIVLEWRGRVDMEHRQVVSRMLEEMPCPVLLLQTPEAERERLAA